MKWAKASLHFPGTKSLEEHELVVSASYAVRGIRTGVRVACQNWEGCTKWSTRTESDEEGCQPENKWLIKILSLLNGQCDDTRKHNILSTDHEPELF